MGKGRIIPLQQPTPHPWILKTDCDCEQCRSAQAVLDADRRKIEAAAITGYAKQGRGVVVATVCQECQKHAADIWYVPLTDIKDAEERDLVSNYDPTREVIVVITQPEGYRINAYPRGIAAAA